MFHFPPLMTIYEMTGDFPCLSQLWDAGSAAEFDAVIAVTGENCLQRSSSIRLSFEALMQDHWPGPEKFPIRYLALHDLHLLVFGTSPELHFV